MKHVKLFLIVICISGFCFNNLSYSQNFEAVYSSYKQKDYFHFKDNLAHISAIDNVWMDLYLRALSDCIFGNFETSNKNISEIIKNYSDVIPDSLMKEIYQNKYYNHIFLFEYNEAYNACNILISKYNQYLTTDEKENLPDELIMLRDLKDVPKQQIRKEGEQRLKVYKDLAGLWRTPITLNDTNIDFVFDTGADFSVIIESLAEKLGVKILGEEFDVGTITDKKIKSKVGVLDKMKIQGITLENVVFYVMKDEDFTFGPYKIEGIIGAPIIKAFGEIQFTKNNEVIIPSEPETKDIKNFAYSGYTPIIQLVYGNDSLNFIFDSGNNGAILFPPFFKKYEQYVTQNFKLAKIKLGGAGGISESEGYVIDKIVLGSGNSSSEIKNIALLINPLTEVQKYFYGNIGQDYFNKFDTLTMNFKNMYIEFK